MATSAADSKTQPATATTHSAIGAITVPRITIQFCTQCKWNLRAAYYAQELLQTFSTSLGEVALLPSTSGTFVIKLYHLSGASEEAVKQTNGSEASLRVQETVIWDRKVDGGFPETKELKNRVRNVVEPSRGLGHTDRALKKAQETTEVEKAGKGAEGNAERREGDEDGGECIDCR